MAKRIRAVNGQGLSVPVGTVLAYAGTLNGPELNALGWALCDGAPMSVVDFSDLFKMLGTCNGGDGNTYFNLPNYQGYFLRGVDPTGMVDPDAGQRVAPASGGACGHNVGSVQGWATANARNPFTASVPHVPNDYHYAYASSDCAILIDGSQTCLSSEGGDYETRPRNAYVRFIIKITSCAGMPTGAVVPFAGSNSAGSPNIAKHFKLCDGTLVQQSEYPSLYKAIQHAHGGSASGFNLPDYRGRFLRGVTGTTPNDPDAEWRVVMNAGGNKGNHVGSIQAWTTGPPRNPFAIEVRVGTDRADSSVCLGHDNSAWEAGSTSVSLTAGGGDSESRPTNVNADFYILANEDANAGDIFPIGGIIGIPGKTPPPGAQWLSCNGAAISNADQYVGLYHAIAHDNGGDDATFNVPDLQGRFLRGCDHGRKRDPDATARLAAKAGGKIGDSVGSVQPWATGRPGRAITAQVQHLPADYHGTSCAGDANHAANWGETLAPTLRGGDHETRPLNAYIQFYIKYTETS